MNRADEARAPSGVPIARPQLGVITPWYPSAQRPWSGTFVAGMTGALADLARVQVVHVVAEGHSVRPRVTAVEHEDDVTRVAVAVPPGGWGLGPTVRTLAAHIPEGMPLLAQAPVPAGVLAAHTGQPYAVVLHGIDVFGARQRRGTRPVGRVSRHVLEGAAAIVAVSDRVRRALPSTLRARTAVVHNGVDLETFHARGRATIDGRPRLLSVGNLGPRKGHDVVLESLPALLVQYPGLQWEVVGEGPLRPALEERAARLGVLPAVTFTGPLSPDQVADRMRAADVFVLPATYEALGCVFLEAMACGLPVVAAQGEGIGEVIRDRVDGLLVEPTPRAVTEVVGRVLGDAHWRAELAQAAAGRASEFDWRQRARELWDVVGAVGR